MTVYLPVTLFLYLQTSENKKIFSEKECSCQSVLFHFILLALTFFFLLHFISPLSFLSLKTDTNHFSLFPQYYHIHKKKHENSDFPGTHVPYNRQFFLDGLLSFIFIILSLPPLSEIITNGARIGAVR